MKNLHQLDEDPEIDMEEAQEEALRSHQWDEDLPDPFEEVLGG